MHAVRAAMLILVGFISFTPAAQGSAPTVSRLSGTSATGVREPRVATEYLVSRLPQATQVVPFLSWKRRTKILFEETDRRVVEEIDLGPAPTPGSPTSCV